MMELVRDAQCIRRATFYYELHEASRLVRGVVPIVVPSLSSSNCEEEHTCDDFCVFEGWRNSDSEQVSSLAFDSKRWPNYTIISRETHSFLKTEIDMSGIYNAICSPLHLLS